MLAVCTQVQLAQLMMVWISLRRSIRAQNRWALIIIITKLPITIKNGRSSGFHMQNVVSTALSHVGKGLFHYVASAFVLLLCLVMAFYG